MISGFTSVMILRIFDDFTFSGEAYHTFAPFGSATHVSRLILLYECLSPRSLSEVKMLKSYSSLIMFTIFLHDWIGPPALKPGSYQSVNSNMVFLADIILL